MRAGSFSRENALYGAMIVACATCQAEPNRVTTSSKEEATANEYGINMAKAMAGKYSLSMTRPTKRLNVTVENVVNFCEYENEMSIIMGCVCVCECVCVCVCVVSETVIT